MNCDDIISMAREHLVKCEYTEFGWQDCHRYEFDDDELLRFAALVAAHEREACAKECESINAYQNDGLDGAFESGKATGMEWCADAIRARARLEYKSY